MSKVAVKGENISEIYKWLTHKSLNSVSDYEIEWNFHKFLINEEGKLVQEIKPPVEPINESILTWLKS